MADLILVATHTCAVTYHFRSVANPQVNAICTVNNQTAELVITCDGQSWAHQWNPATLGVPTLSKFIGTCGDVDYFARKLQGSSSGFQFSATKTAAALRQKLCARRLADGREQISRRWDDAEISPSADRFDNAGLPIFSWHMVPATTLGHTKRREPLPYLTRGSARQLWHKLGQLADDVFTGAGDNSDLFYSRLPAIEGFNDYITEEPWHYAETEQTARDKLLRDTILPALIDVCRASHVPEGAAKQGLVVSP